MIRDIIKQLEKLEEEIKEMRSSKARTEMFLALVMDKIDSVNVNMKDAFDFNRIDRIDHSKIKIRENMEGDITVFYDRESADSKTD